jgi:hypothetical protein
MVFDLGYQLEIDGVIYSVAEHPSALNRPYRQEGRAAVVYKLNAQDNSSWALKVFKPGYRVPALTSQAVAIKSFMEFSALQVCQRTVLSASRHGALLQQHRDLIYAVLMPWVEGPTWADVVISKRDISPEVSLSLARALTSALVTMEENSLAHCDLSGSNLILPALLSDSIEATNGNNVELVDVEQLYAPGLKCPEKLAIGTPGYVHRTLSDQSWGENADRFAGALLLAEILGWCVPEVRAAAWEASYFSSEEMHKDSARLETLSTALKRCWGNSVVTLFERAWYSNILNECPTFGEWLIALPEEPDSNGCDGNGSHNPDEFDTLISLAKDLYSQRHFAATAIAYRHAQQFIPNTISGQSLDRKIADCEARAAEQTSEPRRDENRDGDSQDSLAKIFDAGLHAFQEDRYREAVEFLGEVVRLEPEYTRTGWKAQKLLDDALIRSRPFWQKALRYGARILISAILVLTIVSGVFTISYLSFVRPLVTDSIFTFMRPFLHELTILTGDTGCWTVSEQEINAGIERMVPMLVEDNDLHLDIYGDYFYTSAKIGGRPVWIKLDPPDGYQSSDFALDSLEMSGLLKVLFSPSDLTNFINEYITSEVISSDKVNRIAFDLNDESFKVCAYK